MASWGMASGVIGKSFNNKAAYRLAVNGRLRNPPAVLVHICGHGPVHPSPPGEMLPVMEAKKVTARGISQQILTSGPADGTPVLLIHGNCSSAAFWEPLTRHLPPNLRLIAPDLRGYGGTETAPVDATRG